MHIAAQIMFMSDSNNKKSGGGEQDQQQQQQQQHPFPDLWSNYLQDAFDLLCEKKAAAQEASAGGGAECFYRLSLARVRDWLKGRFVRVARSAAFDRLVFGSSKQQQQQQQPANGAESSAATVADKGSDAREQERRAIAERAFGLVAEYVPTAIQHGDLRRWLLGAENAKYVAPRPPAMTPDFHNSAAAQLLEGGAAGADALKRQKVEAPQSASAKRLAKAGAPKGTPSVASFFVKKK